MVSVSPGTTIADYHILRELGRSRTAMVYQAYDRARQTVVSFKVLHVRSAGHPALIARLRRELTVEPPLCTHPNVQRVYAVGQVRGFPFLATELIDGLTLERRLAAPRTPAPALAIAWALASALDAAHAVGLAHGAVGPASVVLSREGSVLLTNVGLAPLLAALRPLDWHCLAAAEAAYIAPEVVQNGLPSPSADRYALAMLTARMLGAPWATKGTSGTGDLVEAAPTTLPPAVVEPTWEVLRRALAADPAARFPSCEAFCEALARALAPARRGAFPAGP